jgi:hypothetical protein
MPFHQLPAQPQIKISRFVDVDMCCIRVHIGEGEGVIFSWVGRSKFFMCWYVVLSPPIMEMDIIKCMDLIFCMQSMSRENCQLWKHFSRHIKSVHAANVRFCTCSMVQHPFRCIEGRRSKIFAKATFHQYGI